MGNWGRQQVKCAWGESTFSPPPPVQAQIERVWEMLAKRPGVNLFDGEMCRLESYRAEADALSMLFSSTSYKSFCGTNLHNPQFAAEHGSAAMANPVGISVALVSADQQLLLGRRNEKVAYYPGRIHPFAGALEPDDELDVFGAVERELSEELGLASDDVQELRCIGMAEDRSLLQPELVCYAQVRKNLGELKQGLDQAEHEAVVSMEVKPEVFERELSSAKLFTPIALATIALCGQHRFGDGWFNRTCGSS
jgi:8-oxo-dGTP pyrophosphatase MutT (NUDIX family)